MFWPGLMRKRSGSSKFHVSDTDLIGSGACFTRVASAGVLDIARFVLSALAQGARGEPVVSNIK